MKRADAFMLGTTAFVAANCISYFVSSPTPYVTGWGCAPGRNYFSETIGFPFEVLSIGESCAPYHEWSSINLAANVVVAAIVSYFVARWLADRLPPVWPGYSRTSQYSLCGLLAIVTVVLVMLGMATKNPAWGLAVRNVTCFGGPVAIYAWYLCSRQISWMWLTVAAIGPTLLALTIDFRYQDPDIGSSQILKAVLPLVQPAELTDWVAQGEYSHRLFARCFVGLTVIRTVVPIFGLLSLLVLTHAAYDIVRPNRETLLTYGKKCLRYLLNCLRWG
jgi:hypothetical protein